MCYKDGRRDRGRVPRKTPLREGGMAVPGPAGKEREQRGSEGWSRLLQGDLVAESSKASFKINQFREDTTRCRLLSESTALAT